MLSAQSTLKYREYPYQFVFWNLLSQSYLLFLQFKDKHSFRVFVSKIYQINSYHLYSKYKQ